MRASIAARAIKAGDKIYYSGIRNNGKYIESPHVVIENRIHENGCLLICEDNVSFTSGNVDRWDVDLFEPTLESVVYLQAVQEVESLQAAGIIWAINRYIFHPRGFAFSYDEDKGLFAVIGPGDMPYAFQSDDEDNAGFAAFEAILNSVRAPVISDTSNNSDEIGVPSESVID